MATVTFSVKNFDRFQHYKDRAPPWIKIYNELLDDYEFGALPDASKMHLIAIWLLASRSENKIPFDPEWVARRINATEPVDLKALAAKGFIVVDQELQGTEQCASTPLAKCLSREETEERREETDISAVAKATRPDEMFEKFWQERPRRKGDDPRKPAEEQFRRLVKSGEDPEVIIAGVKFARIAYAEQGKTNTEFIPQMVKWLRDRRYRDFAEAGKPDAAVSDGLIEVLDDDALAAWDAYGKAKSGKTFPRNSRGGWRFPTRWPPGYKPIASRGETPAIAQFQTMQ